MQKTDELRAMSFETLKENGLLIQTSPQLVTRSYQLYLRHENFNGLSWKYLPQSTG